MSEYIGDADPVDFYVEPVFRARKEHTCCACKSTIRKGDLYVRASSGWEGQVETWKRCGRCQKTLEHLRKLCNGDNEMQPREDLGCGLKYEAEWGGAPPAEIQALPFMTADEASELLLVKS